MSSIPYARQSIDDGDVQEVIRVLRSPFLTQGPEVDRFERAVGGAVGGRFCIAVTNATSALHLACKALGVGPGDTVWTSPNSFVASANCARYCDASIDFVDIEPRSRNIDPVAFEEKLRSADRGERPLPKVIVLVHFGGTPADLAPISNSARRRGIAVIEDASHALGATYRDTSIGDSTFSDITVFSFHPVKIITTGEGGMLVTASEKLCESLKLLRSHGITRDENAMKERSEGPWYYEQLDLGFNYRLTDLQAALGSRQIQRLPQFLARRRALAARYSEELSDLDIGLPWCDRERTSAWHLFPVTVSASSRAAIFNELRARGILVNVHYIPIHLQPYYRALGFKRGDFPNAEKYYAEAVSLPMYYELSDAEQSRVINTFHEVVGNAKDAPLVCRTPDEH